jgi:hypothetical protein
VAARAGARPAVPADGRQVVARDPKRPDAFYRAIGFVPLGIAAVRVDLLERLGRLVREAAKRVGDKPFELPAEIGPALGAFPGEAALLLAALGYRTLPTAVDGGKPRFVAARRPARKGARPARPAVVPRPDSPFAKLAELKLKR